LFRTAENGFGMDDFISPPRSLGIDLRAHFKSSRSTRRTVSRSKAKKESPSRADLPLSLALLLPSLPPNAPIRCAQSSSFVSLSARAIKAYDSCKRTNYSYDGSPK
jgi:hypothetical protein